jgi:DNA-binding NtrC family response regulator
MMSSSSTDGLLLARPMSNDSGPDGFEPTRTHDYQRPSAAPHVLLFGEGWSRVHELDPNVREVLIGRGADCGLVVDDTSVSRHHLLLVLGDQPSVRDLGSSNGTLLDGSVLASGETRTLSPGSRIQLGAVTIVVYASSADPSPTSAPEDLPLDDPMHAVHDLCDRVAASDLGVLILGETGTGKELLAERIHARSNRASARLLRLNAAAVPEALAESELFGHERGAFTGALQAKEGLLAAASGGTVLLDEIGDLPASVQSKLLRVLEAGEIMRVGATKAIHVDVRYLSATSRDVEALIADGRVRADLMYRLAGVTIRVPPLRERRSSILPLARRLLRSACGPNAPVLAPDAERALVEHPWPGNVRELKATVQRAAVLSGQAMIEARHLVIGAFNSPVLSSAPGAPSQSVTEPPPPVSTGSGPASLRDDVRAIERDRILAALDACGGNQTRAAAMLGIARRTLTAKLDQLEVVRPRKPRP